MNTQAINVDLKKLKAELQIEAKALGLSDKTSAWTIECVLERISNWLDGRPAITEADLNRKLANELAKYNADLAYVYQNRGKII